MRQSKYFHYFVEGDDEEKIIDTLKTEMQLIIPGKVEVFNVVERELTRLRLISLKKGTTVVLVFDIDTGKIDTLLKNIAILKRESAVSNVLCITQVQNLEDELIRSCDIRQIKELTGSKSNKDFKHDLIRGNRIDLKLIKHNFNFERFWSCCAENQYKDIQNDSNKIRIRNK